MEPSEPQSNNGNKKALVAFVMVLAVVLVAVGAAMFSKKDADDDATATSATSQTTTPEATGEAGTSESKSTAASSADGQFKDGTYQATGSYMTPGGQQKIGVSITLKDGVVTDSSLEQTAENKETKEYQGKFASGYKPLVVGKKLDQIQLSRVSGSSLTSQGFHNALQDIEQQAQAKS